jgi:hypothetical protein
MMRSRVGRKYPMRRDILRSILKAAVHHAARRCGGCVAARGARAAGVPHDGREFEYCIKSANEEHERVARESELTKA